MLQHVTQFDFCDGKVGFNVRSDVDKARICRELGVAFGVRVVQLSHADRYHGGMADVLRRGKHHVATMLSSGTGYFLYLTRIEFAGVCVFVDKRVKNGHFYPKMILARLMFDDVVFDDTVLDGELVKCRDGKWVFLIGDIHADCGDRLMGRASHQERMTRISRIIARQWHPDDQDPCALCVKAFFHPHRLKEVSFDALDYDCRGICFRPLMKNAGRDVHFIFPSDRTHPPLLPAPERKERRNDDDDDPIHPAANTDNNTSDHHDDDGDMHMSVFHVRRTAMPDVYELYVRKEHIGLAPPDAVAGVPTLLASQALRDAFVSVGDHDCVTMPFRFNAKFRKWVPDVSSSYTRDN